MEAIEISGLESNPGQALRMAERDLVIVLKDKVPDAVMVGLESLGVLDAGGVRAALATALFRDGHLSLVRAAHLADMSASDFASHLSRLDIPVVDMSAEEVEQDLDTLDEWLAKS